MRARFGARALARPACCVRPLHSAIRKQTDDPRFGRRSAWLPRGLPKVSGFFAMLSGRLCLPNAAPSGIGRGSFARRAGLWPRSNRKKWTQARSARCFGQTPLGVETDSGRGNPAPCGFGKGGLMLSTCASQGRGMAGRERERGANRPRPKALFVRKGPESPTTPPKALDVRA